MRAEGTIETTMTGAETIEERVNVGTTTDATTGTTIELTEETTTEKTVRPNNTKRSVRKTDNAGLLFSGTRSPILVPVRTDLT